MRICPRAIDSLVTERLVQIKKEPGTWVMASAAADISSQRTQEGDQGVHTNCRRHRPQDQRPALRRYLRGRNFWGAQIA
jgi:hypothetical protein